MPTPRNVLGVSFRHGRCQRRRAIRQTSGVARGTTLHKAAPSIRAPPMNFTQPPSTYSKGSLGKSSDEEKKAIALATEELKDMLQYGHLELADKTMDPGYLQHNPNVPQGRDGFKTFMAARPGRTPEPLKPEWKDAPSITLVSGPYVVFAWDRKAKDPNDPSQEYVWNHYDIVRVEKGLIKEHWDEARINPPAPANTKKQ